MVSASAEMSIPDIADLPGVEQPRLPQARFRKQVFRPVPQRPPQPVAKRNPKAHFRSFHQTFWNVAVEHLPEQPLAYAAADFCRARQMPRKLNDTMIEQWHASFQRYRHAGAIDLGEDVVGQVGYKVEKLHSFEQAGEVSFGLRIPQDTSRLDGARYDQRRIPMRDQAAVKVRIPLGAENRRKLV